MTEERLAEQVTYYRKRAREYDATSYGTNSGALERVGPIVAGLGIRGRVLEIACGTEVWTAELAKTAYVEAIDTSPEALRLAHLRCGDDVDFEVRDAFDPPPGPYDAVFLGFWLSHVPAGRFADFWAALAERTHRVLFVDEHPSADGEVWAGEEEAVRTLTDGRTYTIVKAYVDPAATAARLAEIGWDATIRRDGDWVVGEARPR